MSMTMKRPVRSIALLVLAGAATIASAVDIGPGLTGAWYDPQQNGHGLFLEVLPQNQFLAFWFTFNPDGTQQSWFGGVGTYSGATATVPVELTTGGRWIPNFDASKIVNSPWGTLTFTFTDCNSGRVDFASTYPGYGSSHMALTRLTLPAGLTCASTPVNVSKAKGVWAGTTSLNERVVAVVLEDGTFYLVYTQPGTTTDAAVVEGTSTATNGEISSANAKNFPIAQAEEVNGAARTNSVSGTYTPQGRLQLTISSSTTTRNVSADYVPGSEQAPSLAALAGHYTGATGHIGGRRAAVWTIDDAGRLSLSNTAGCTLTGTITPHAAVHAFDWTITESAAGSCIFDDEGDEATISGMLYYDEATRRICAFAPYDERIEDFFMIGTKM
jgi:hypothetical protein